MRAKIARLGVRKILDLSIFNSYISKFGALTVQKSNYQSNLELS